MYLIIFLATLILYIINKNMDFLYVSGLFAIASGLSNIGLKMKNQNEENLKEYTQFNTADK